MQLNYSGFTCHSSQGCVSLRFDNKPSDEILRALKANGFRWQRESQIWVLSRKQPWADLVAWIDREMNPEKLQNS